MQIHRHFEKHLEFINLRTVFRSGDVEFDNAFHVCTTGSFADAEVGGLTTFRTDSAGLKAKSVETTVLRTQYSILANLPCRPGATVYIMSHPSHPLIITKPVWLERGLHSARKMEVTQRPFDSEFFQQFLLHLPATVAQLCRRLANLACLARGGWKSAVEHHLCRAVVAIHVRRRKRKLRADALIPVPERVLIQFPRFRWIIAHSEQIVDRVLVFLTA